LDYEKVKGGERVMALPPMMKGAPKTTKHSLGAGRQYEYSLPCDYKFTSDESYTNVDIVREKLRRNLVDHQNFQPMLAAEEGQKYYAKVYQPNKDVYVTVDDPAKKNKLLKIRKPPTHVNPHEIDPMRDPAVAASRHVDADGKKHIDLTLAKKSKRRGPSKPLSRDEEEARERDLLGFILKYENFVRATSSIG
jgi:hypothetical protein